MKRLMMIVMLVLMACVLVSSASAAVYNVTVDDAINWDVSTHIAQPDTNFEGEDHITIRRGITSPGPDLVSQWTIFDLDPSKLNGSDVVATYLCLTLKNYTAIGAWDPEVEISGYVDGYNSSGTFINNSILTHNNGLSYYFIGGLPARTDQVGGPSRIIDDYPIVEVPDNTQCYDVSAMNPFFNYSIARFVFITDGGVLDEYVFYSSEAASNQPYMIQTINETEPESSTGGSTRYLVNGTGDVVGVSVGGAVTLFDAPKERLGPDFLMIGESPGSTDEDIIQWFKDLFSGFKGFFVRGSK